MLPCLLSQMTQSFKNVLIIGGSYIGSRAAAELALALIRKIQDLLTAVCIIQGMRLFILKKNKCLVNSISPSILHRMI